MSVSGTPHKPPPPPPVVVALLIAIFAGVLYIAVTLNQIKNIEQGKVNAAVQTR